MEGADIAVASSSLMLRWTWTGRCGRSLSRVQRAPLALPLAVGAIGGIAGR